MRYFIVFYQALFEPKGWDKGNFDLMQETYTLIERNARN